MTALALDALEDVAGGTRVWIQCSCCGTAGRGGSTPIGRTKEEKEMASDRWEGKVHYYEYSAHAPERYPAIDAFKAAEGYVYNDGGFAIGAVLVIFGHDLLAGVKLADAISKAREVLRGFLGPDIAGNYADDVRNATSSKTYLYNWNGQFIRQIFP